MFLNKWGREELDSNVGRKKGSAYYWDQLVKLYNDGSYVPTECVEFKHHVTSCGTDSRYSTKMLSEYRTDGRQPAYQIWTALKGNYVLFHNKYVPSERT